MAPDIYCRHCAAPAVYRCAVTGAPVCPAHARLLVVKEGERPVAPTPDRVPLVRPATPADRPAIEALALHFWEETEVECLGQIYDVLALPAFVADDAGEVVGCLVYAVEGAGMTLVMLNVWPSHQGIGIGKRLLQAAIATAQAQGLDMVRVATTNDDLPALALYQQHGFQLTGLMPGLVADHHG